MAHTVLEVAVLNADENTIHLLLDDEPNDILQDAVHAKLLDKIFYCLAHTDVSSEQWLRIFEFLLLKGAQLERMSSYPYIPVTVYTHGSVQILKYLVATGFQLKKKFKSWENHVLHLALKNAEFEVFKYLVKNLGLHIDSRNYLRETPLHVASSNLSYQLVKNLIMMGANPDSRQFDGCSPLTLAIQNSSDSSEKCIKYLLRVSAKATVLKAFLKTFRCWGQHHLKSLIENLTVIHNYSLFDIELFSFLFSPMAQDYEYGQHFITCQREVMKLKSVMVFNGITLHDLYVRLYKKDNDVILNPHIRSYLASFDDYLEFPIFGPLLSALDTKLLSKLRRNRIAVYTMSKILRMDAPGLLHISELVIRSLQKLDVSRLATMPSKNEISALFSTNG